MHSGVAVIGALGNLRTKLLCHLASRGFRKLIGLDVRENPDHADLIREAATAAGYSTPDVRIQACDLTDP